LTCRSSYVNRRKLIKSAMEPFMFKVAAKIAAAQNARANSAAAAAAACLGSVHCLAYWL